ncbi:GntR family transcriptional regulator [Microbacterium sediminicola]|uniref:GntR family transcriptional regulator n=1 Tax=Microbacterium sediminicola TaxID=415210 RepID=A0ABP4U168_9MICO
MLIRIDPNDAQPLFAQVAASIRAQIADGVLRVGERLPAARELAISLGINLHTVLRAYQDLRDEGLVDLRRGRGAVVTDSATALAALRVEMAQMVHRARAHGISASTLASLMKEISDDV